MDSVELTTLNNSVCSFIKAKSTSKPLIRSSNDKSHEESLRNCLNYLNRFQNVIEMKIINSFLKDFTNDSTSSILNSNANSNGNYKIPVYIFNPSNLTSSTATASASPSVLLQNYLKKSLFRAVLLDCAEIESKTEFFSEIFKGIIGDELGKLDISYDFNSFQAAFNTLKPTKDIVLIVNNSSQINLTHLDDFVRLWERKSRDFLTIPRLNFVFDDSVCFLGMESRLRDRFRVQEFKVESVMQVFDELIVEMVQNGFSLLLHPKLMERFVQLATSGTISFSSLINQLKFLIIAHYNTNPNVNNCNIPTSMSQIFLFITELSSKLKELRPSAPKLSPSKDFYSACFYGILLDCQSFSEVLNELKSIAPNDFVKLFKSLNSANVNDDKSSSSATATCLIEKIKFEIISSMEAKGSDSSVATKKSELKDFQLDLIKTISDILRGIKRIEISCDLIVKDERGNVRRAFEADFQASLQVSLKFPSFYLNYEDESALNSCLSGLKSSKIQSHLSSSSHNQPNMPDCCLLYRISLEFPSKIINLFLWYNSFLSVLNEKKSDSLSVARFFKSLNELQLIGMVSEFGRSRRKRRFVERFNITDTLNYDHYE